MSFNYPLDLHFTCSQCGLCCGDTKQKTRHILLTKNNAETIANVTKHPIACFANQTPEKTPYVYEMKKTPQTGQCVFLKNNQCTLYEVRPLICRFYPFELSTNGEGVYTFRATEECPSLCRSEANASGNALDETFFTALLVLARAELEDSVSRTGGEHPAFQGRNCSNGI
ncbi:MAG: YkgJ family cysteine cluster protein [Candidatus Bathyarchaeota archaeon]|nr:YkgJ family cysteine cluster protein [Candidatus Bathyarchaeota archaeon]